MNRFIATVDVAKQKCTGLTILQEVPESTADFLYLEVPDDTYYNRNYINGEWGDFVAEEVPNNTGDKMKPLAEGINRLEEQALNLQEGLLLIENSNLQFELELDARLTDIEMNLKGGE